MRHSETTSKHTRRGKTMSLTTIRGYFDSSLILFFCLIIGGCSFSQWGRDMGEGVVAGANERADTLAASVVRGATNALTDSLAKARISSLVALLADTLNERGMALRDSILGAETEELLRRLRSSVIGAETKDQIAALREEIAGRRTRELLDDMRDDLLGGETRNRVDSLKNILLGESTRAALDSIISEAVVSLARGYDQQIKPRLEEGGSIVKTIKNYAIEILCVVAALIIVVSLILSRRRTKERNADEQKRNALKQTLEVLTYEIDKMPSQQSYDELTKRIRHHAQERKVEPLLQGVLAEQGLK